MDCCKCFFSFNLLTTTNHCFQCMYMYLTNSSVKGRILTLLSAALNCLKLGSGSCPLLKKGTQFKGQKKLKGCLGWGVALIYSGVIFGI